MKKRQYDFLISMSIYLIFGFLLMFCSQQALAASTPASGSGMPTISSMFANFSNSVPSINTFISATAFLVGFLFCIGSLLDMTKVANNQASIKLPLAKFIAGILLINYGATFMTLNNTFGYPKPSSTSVHVFSSSTAHGKGPLMNSALQGIVGLVEIIGNISFFAGIIGFKDYGEGKQGATFRKAFFRFVGGALLINFVATANVLHNTFFPGLPQFF